MILNILSLGPQLYLVSNVKYSLLNLWHWNACNMVAVQDKFGNQSGKSKNENVKNIVK